MEKVTKAVIPAAGWGTRFFPITKAMPKEMVPVIDKPVIQYVVEEAVASGCDDILIITGKNKRAIEDHFDNNPELNKLLALRGDEELIRENDELTNLADIHFIRQKEQKGLGDAILCAKQHVGSEPFAVLLGDTICVADFGEKPCTGQLIDVYYKYRIPVIGVEPVPVSKIKDYGIIDGDLIDDALYKIRDVIEKPSPEVAPSNIGAMGRYVFTPDIFPILENTKPGLNNEVQLADALHCYSDYLGYITKNTRYDIGDIPGWIGSNIQLLLRDPKYSKIVWDIIDKEKLQQI